MSNFFLEIYGEEIPSDYQSWLEESLKAQIENLLNEKKINFSQFTTFSTPRRVIIQLNKVNEFSETNEIKLRGPQTSAPKKAISGFLKSNNLSNVETLSIFTLKDKEYYLYKKTTPKKKTFDVLKEGLPQILLDMNWKKSMRWGDHQEKWIRPIKSIICMMENRIIPFCFAGIKSGKFSEGNYFYSKKKIKFENIKQYLRLLGNNNVIISRYDRIESIKNQIQKFCKKNNLEFQSDCMQLEKIANSVEYPNVFFGRFEKSFFEIPDFLIKCIVSEKQDFFHFKDLSGNLTNFFSFVTNRNHDNHNVLIRGNEKVLKARFSDALFFLEEDKKVTFEARLTNLKKIIFYENVGTLFDRAHRIKKLILVISKLLVFKINKYEENFLQYSNSDLVTEVVKEFPSLQGKVGGYYLSLICNNKRLSQAFSEQYLTTFKKTNNNTLSFIVSIAQKIDSIYGFFLTKKKISGSGDPFGVRRALLGLIKIATDKNIDINFMELFHECREIYLQQGVDESIDEEYLVKYFNKRIKVFFLELDYKYDLIEACCDSDKLNPFLMKIKLDFLSKFISSPNGKEFLSAHKRLFSIIQKEDRSCQIKENLFMKKEEVVLFELCKNTEKLFSTQPWKVYLQINNIISFTKPINKFLDTLKVNVENAQLKENRICLLIKCIKTLNLFFKFHEIEKNET